ncbi:MAG: flagellar hook protein FlgE [Ignavibacteriales bacterium]|nr:flagellar hook protein FlgE [Ignavibacteriales bacterium]
MAFLRSLSAGVTGLQNYTTMMDVIGNNVANINTIGFKSSRITFGELFSQTVRGATQNTGTTGGTNPVQVGLGASVMSIDTIFSQGVIESTGNQSDLAIEGSGLFIVRNGNKNLYTRVGAYERDSTGALVMKGTGAVLQGKLANGQGVIPAGASLGDVVIDMSRKSAPKATDVAKIAGNLDASAATYVPAAAGPPAVPESGGKVNTTFNVFDSLGITHAFTATLTKNATANKWDYKVTDAAGVSLGTGSVTFNADGSVATGSPAVIPAVALTNGASSLNVSLDFSTLTQTQGTSVLTPTNIAGYASGDMSSWAIDQNGYITGSFTNGQVMTLGRIVLGEPTNPSGLSRVGDGLYDISPNSGTISIINPGAGSTSRILPSSLEQSNVDLPEEFTKMIVAQRGFQANSRVITTSDEILNEVVNLKR